CRTLQSGAALLESVADPRVPIKSLYMASYIQRQRGNIRDFLLGQERVVQLARRFQWPEGAASAAMGIGELHSVTRDYALAVEDLRTAYAAALQCPNPDIAAEALYGLAIAQMKNGDAAAETTLRAARERTLLSGG